MTAFDSDFENIPDPEALFSNLPKDQLDPANAVAIRILLWGLGCVNRLNFGGKSTASLSKRSVFLDKLSAVVEQKWPAVSATKAQVNARKSMFCFENFFYFDFFGVINVWKNWLILKNSKFLLMSKNFERIQKNFNMKLFKIIFRS